MTSGGGPRGRNEKDGARKAPRRAAALRYDPDRDRAPRVVAAGERFVAEAIVHRAEAAGVPVYEDGELAAALVTLPPGREIPPDLYQAIARVLVFVRGLDEARAAQTKDARSRGAHGRATEADGG